MELSDARYKAERIVSKLAPYCDKTLIVGSIRRKMRECSDIDIVLQVKQVPIKDLFDNTVGHKPMKEFVDIVNSWEKIKGDPTGKYTQRRLEDGTKLELTMASQETWASLTLIRTGNAEFTHMLMKRVLRCGFEQRNGHLYEGDRMIELHEEEDYFRVLNLPYIKPENRDINAFRR